VKKYQDATPAQRAELRRLAIEAILRARTIAERKQVKDALRATLGVRRETVDGWVRAYRDAHSETYDCGTPEETKIKAARLILKLRRRGARGAQAAVARHLGVASNTVADWVRRYREQQKLNEGSP
jgi:transposase-like protein